MKIADHGIQLVSQPNCFALFCFLKSEYTSIKAYAHIVYSTICECVLGIKCHACIALQLVAQQTTDAIRCY